MLQVTFENLPEIVSKLSQEVNQLSQLIRKDQNCEKDQSEDIVNMQGLSEFLGISVNTLYSKCSDGSIPYMKFGGRNYFSKKEILDYLEQNRVSNNSDLNNQVDELLTNRKSKGGK